MFSEGTRARLSLAALASTSVCTCNSLSILGKGKGIVPTCFSSLASISNSYPSTLDTASRNMSGSLHPRRRAPLFQLERSSLINRNRNIEISSLLKFPATARAMPRGNGSPLHLSVGSSSVLFMPQEERPEATKVVRSATSRQRRSGKKNREKRRNQNGRWAHKCVQIPLMCNTD